MSLDLEEAQSLGAWIRLTLLQGIGSVNQRALLKAFGSPDAIFEASAEALASVIGAKLAQAILFQNDDSHIDHTLNWAAQTDHHILVLGASSYPTELLSICDPPTLLYARGQLSALNHPAIAVVGSRNATAGGLKNAEKFSTTLVESGFNIVSGLALGIDTAAHQGALAGSRRGATIAVTGTGIDRVYPSRNQALAHRIVDEGGLILTEFALGVGVQAHHFPRRNRIISGLSQGVLVVEAASQSGSLITARLAGEQGREVFAIPGSIHSPQSRGCHRLIKEGAKLVECAADILNEMGWQHHSPFTNPENVSATCKKNKETPLSGQNLLDALGGDSLSIDELVERCGLTADSLLAMLFELELTGHVASLPGGRFQRLG